VRHAARLAPSAPACSSTWAGPTGCREASGLRHTILHRRSSRPPAIVRAGCGDLVSVGWHWAWLGAGNVSLLVVRWHGRAPGTGEGRGSGLAWPLKAVSWVGTGGGALLERVADTMHAVHAVAAMRHAQGPTGCTAGLPRDERLCALTAGLCLLTWLVRRRPRRRTSRCR